MVKKSKTAFILTINAGSSSIKFSVCADNEALERVVTGSIAHIGTDRCALEVIWENEGRKLRQDLGPIAFAKAEDVLSDWLETHVETARIGAVGHRVVFGPDHPAPVLLSEQVVEEISNNSALDPEHLPSELSLIRKMTTAYPRIPQAACFDTSFHTTLPEVASTYALPVSVTKGKLKKLGFHGLSCAYMLTKLHADHGEALAQSRLILAHLGGGCSITAVRDGRSMDTSMGFTPTGGMMMGTRTGDLDPGVIDHLLRSGKVTAAGLSDLINHQSGLAGISGVGQDMAFLLKAEHTNAEVARAIAVFCYQAARWIASMTAAIGGIDGLVFSGGIGENVPAIRARICSYLAYLGVHADERRNEAGTEVISPDGEAVKVLVIRANEEYMLARLVRDLMKS